MATKTLTTRDRDRQVAALERAIRFTVEGEGRFPVDMIRYDRCWPTTMDDVAIAFHFQGSRRVRMTSILGPTAGRWESFGWRVV